jgi:hypothetical protein
MIKLELLKTNQGNFYLAINTTVNQFSEPFLLKLTYAQYQALKVLGL